MPLHLGVVVHLLPLELQETNIMDPRLVYRQHQEAAILWRPFSGDTIDSSCGPVVLPIFRCGLLTWHFLCRLKCAALPCASSSLLRFAVKLLSLLGSWPTSCYIVTADLETCRCGVDLLIALVVHCRRLQTAVLLLAAPCPSSRRSAALHNGRAAFRPGGEAINPSRRTRRPSRRSGP